MKMMLVNGITDMIVKMMEQIDVLRRTLREVLDSGYSDCLIYPDSHCMCDEHERARSVWLKAEAVLAGEID
jgi:hypothetical protein